jgi:hypothetical protein
VTSAGCFSAPMAEATSGGRFAFIEILRFKTHTTHHHPPRPRHHDIHVCASFYSRVAILIYKFSLQSQPQGEFLKGAFSLSVWCVVRSSALLVVLQGACFLLPQRRSTQQTPEGNLAASLTHVDTHHAPLPHAPRF